MVAESWADLAADVVAESWADVAADVVAESWADVAGNTPLTSTHRPSGPQST